MTDDEAREALKDAQAGNGWINWTFDGSDKPLWSGKGPDATICLDGDFTRRELLAVLHFYPEQPCKPV